MTREICNAAFLASAAGWENVDGNFLVQLLIIITAAASIITMVLGWFRKTPPDTEKYRHVKDCEHLCQANMADHEKIDREMNERLSSMSGHSAASREKLYLRMTAVESELSAIKKENELQTQQLYSLSQKMDRYIERKVERENER